MIAISPSLQGSPRCRSLTIHKARPFSSTGSRFVYERQRKLPASIYTRSPWLGWYQFSSHCKPTVSITYCTQCPIIEELVFKRILELQQSNQISRTLWFLWIIWNTDGRRTTEDIHHSFWFQDLSRPKDIFCSSSLLQFSVKELASFKVCRSLTWLSNKIGNEDSASPYDYLGRKCIGSEDITTKLGVRVRSREPKKIETEALLGGKVSMVTSHIQGNMPTSECL